MRLVWVLLKAELRSEWRYRYALSGIALYVVVSVLLLNFSLVQLSDDYWLPLYWLILLFAAVNAAGRSFLGTSNDALRYYYFLASPLQFLFSRLIYNIFLLWLIAGLTLLFLFVFYGAPFQEWGGLILCSLIGSASFAATFTVAAAIAGKASASGTLLTIISFPLIVPQLLVVLQVSGSYLPGAEPATLANWFTLSALFVLVVALAILLFPALWKE